MEITLNNNQASGVTIVKASGRIDAVSVSGFEEQTLPLSESGDNALVLDFSELIYISSAGLRAILKLAKKCKALNKKLLICGLCNEVLEVFKISGFDLILDIKTDLNAAIDATK